MCYPVWLKTPSGVAVGVHSGVKPLRSVTALDRTRSATIAIVPETSTGAELTTGSGRRGVVDSDSDFAAIAVKSH